MVQSSRRPRAHPRAAARAAACTAAAVLLAAPAVAGWPSPAVAAGAPGPPYAAVLSVPAADEPADPAAAKEQIEKNWTAFFDPKTPTDEKAALLQHGDLLKVLLDGFSAGAEAAKASVEVTDVVFTSPTGAEVTYDLKVGDDTVLPGSKGTVVFEDGVWKVSLKTLCSLVELSGAEAPPLVC
ncbi:MULTISPECIES: hypothetical protein [Streptomyces]|uniref:hypothetical protein n=1 Tax=Streptomyces TaxID=1883 RepID=UPI00207AC109|nr:MULTISPECIES: hypothetical protein [Streptomyces]MCM9078719.1 hypothetical protein [Streptomyces spororaveus]MCX5306866.1 hypothetical protein [Streptomyces sp. NBC_00160]